ncbi:MAG: hypothetical protein EA425_05050 [Puniceicoccaceae bacterium]|nr:MAG: hypothetical protein EA425_05050 [Puniceicoccaceae bacterium]
MNFTCLEQERYWPENVFQRDRAFKKWPGDIEGRTLLAWILLEQATGRAARYLDCVIDSWPAELNERGYFGNIYTDGISEQQLSGHGWALQALAELERLRPGGPARRMADPLIERLFLPTAGCYQNYSIDPSERQAAGEYSGSHLKQIGAWILSTDVGCFGIGMAGLIDASEAFGRSGELAPLITEMIDCFLAIDLEAIRAQTHATLSACRGLLRWARIAGRNELVFT